MIEAAPAAAGYGEQFAVRTPDADRVRHVRLIRLGSTTHSFDMNTRLSTLGFTPGGDGLRVTAPATGNLAPPGHYMLFLLDADGVPSIARIISIGTPSPQ